MKQIVRQKILCKGGALIEVVVAAFILSAGILGILNANIESKKFEQSAQRLQKAVICAQSQLENMRAKSFSDITTQSSNQLINNSLCNSMYTASVTKPAAGTGYQILSVTVSWNNRHNKARTITLSTIFADTSAANSGETLLP